MLRHFNVRRLEAVSRLAKQISIFKRFFDYVTLRSK